MVAGMLAGMHAHEMASVIGQLLVTYHDDAGGGADSPVSMSAQEASSKQFWMKIS